MKDELGFDFRIDGNYLIKEVCTSCHEPFISHALMNSDPHRQHGMNRCWPCRQVDEWEEEWKKSQK